MPILSGLPVEETLIEPYAALLPLATGVFQRTPPSGATLGEERERESNPP